MIAPRSAQAIRGYDGAVSKRHLCQWHSFAVWASKEMTITTISSATASPMRSGMMSGLLRLLRVCVDALATYWVGREAIKTLRQLDDRTLRDIGISRCQIEPAVTGDLGIELVRIR